MLKILPEHPQQLLKAALGELACDIVFTNAKIVNVFTGEVLNGDVYVYEGFIAHVEYEHPGVIDVPVNETIDCEGMYLIPHKSGDLSSIGLRENMYLRTQDCQCIRRPRREVHA